MKKPTEEQLELIEVMCRCLKEEFHGETEEEAQEWLNAHWRDFYLARRIAEIETR